MKKHSGKVLTAGIMLVLFGLIVMGVVSLVDERILGEGQSAKALGGAVSATMDLSWAILILAGLVLALGAFMFTQPD